MDSDTMLDLILDSSPHFQGILTSEMSAFDLLRLATVTRKARLVSLRQLGRRKIDLLINSVDEQTMHKTVDENGERAKTMTVIEPKLDREAEYKYMIRKNYAGALIELARNSRIRRLEFKKFVNCEELHVDDRDRDNCYYDGPPLNVVLPIVKVPSIDLSIYSRIIYKDVYNFIWAYQLGRRDIRYLICGVELAKKMSDIDNFIDHLLENLPVSDEIPYSAEAEMNINVVEHMKHMAYQWCMHTEVPSRALRVGGPHGGRHLVVVVRQFDYLDPSLKKLYYPRPPIVHALKTALALGIYEKND